jgi:dienelactone hydrolase
MGVKKGMCVALCMCVLSLVAIGQTETMSPPEIWAEYDPRAEPLDEEILKAWEEEGVTYKEVYFNGEQFDGDFVRIYGIYAAPTGGKNLPALLHIHGGGQTVNTYWLKELAQRGYAVLSFNWGGEWPNRKRFTLWNNVPNGDHKKRNGSQVTLPTPRSDSYFLWTQASMRAVTYLENQGEVNPEKIGAFGISMGGSIMWNLAFDSRIKAGCAIYGAGWNSYTYRDPKYAIGNPPYTPTENELRWRTSLAPEASAPYVNFPMLFLDGSNDRHGYMDRAEDSLNLIPADVPWAWALTPRFRHHIGADFIHDLPGWMDVHLKGEGIWPDNPETKIQVGPDGVPRFVMKPDRPQDVAKVDLFYALENPYPVNRHWRDGRISESDGVYSGLTPVMDADEYLFAFANITYRSGIVISSPLQAVIPKALEAVATIKQPSRTFYDGAEGLSGWTSNSTGTDPIPSLARHRLMATMGPEGKPGFTVDRVSPWTYAPGDPEFRAPKGASLQFDIKTEMGEQFEVKLHKNYWVADFSTYSCTVALEADKGWQTVTLSGADFKEEKSGEFLGDSINEVDVLELAMPKKQGWNDTEIIFRNFRWVGGEYVPHVHAYRDGKTDLGGTDFSSDDAAHLLEHEAVKAEPLLRNVTFSSTNEYRVVQNGFKKGAVLWTDRAYTVKTFPVELEGATYIQAPMADRANKRSGLIAFTVDRDCTVYVGIKDGAMPPEWMGPWSKTDLIVQASNVLVYYRKAFSAGETVVLGSSLGLSAMYSVVVVEAP